MRFIVKCIATLLLYITIIDADVTLPVFPKTIEEMDSTFLKAKEKATLALSKIVATPREEQTFENTIKAYDKLLADFAIHHKAITTIGMVHPDPLIRSKAEELEMQYGEFGVDHLRSNRQIYEIFTKYKPERTLSDEELYYLQTTIESLQLDGFELPEQDFQRVNELHKKLAQLESQFYSNIALDTSCLKVTKDQLLGVDEGFVTGLERDGEYYILYPDRPTRDKILSKCHLESTRKAFYHLYTTVAYPQNLDILKNVVALRHELASSLGFQSYAEFDIKGTMAESPENVQQFLNRKKESISTIWNHTIHPWDSLYLSHQHKQKFYQVDLDAISEYFPFETTLKGMFSVFGKFLNMQFTVVKTNDLWHQDAFLVQVADATGIVLGYIAFDLFPRTHKYTHCCCMSIIHPGNDALPLAVVITNFTKATANRPALLFHNQVITLFHEFGHAVHALVGTAEMPTHSGSNVLHDFVEVPSQFFEAFACDPEILASISAHYITGNPLSATTIEQIRTAKNLDDGSSATTSAEVCYSLQSLHIFNSDPTKDLEALEKAIQQKVLPLIESDYNEHALASFEHLMGYGAKYYTYLWSKDLSEQLMSYIQAHGGLQDPAMGKRYREKIIGKGGSAHPNKLMEDFFSSQNSTTMD